MKLQVKPKQWQCVVTAFAMALEVPVAELIERLGHDGGEIVFPDLPEPRNRRGHNIYELIEVAVDLGRAVTPVPLRAATKPDRYSQRQFILGSDRDNWRRFMRHLQHSRGVIECGGPLAYHLLTYERGRIFDPDGREFVYSPEACERRNHYTHCLWRIDRIATCHDGKNITAPSTTRLSPGSRTTNSTGGWSQER